MKYMARAIKIHVLRTEIRVLFVFFKTPFKDETPLVSSILGRGALGADRRLRLRPQPQDAKHFHGGRPLGSSGYSPKIAAALTLFY